MGKYHLEFIQLIHYVTHYYSDSFTQTLNKDLLEHKGN